MISIPSSRKEIHWIEVLKKSLHFLKRLMFFIEGVGKAKARKSNSCSFPVSRKN